MSDDRRAQILESMNEQREETVEPAAAPEPVEATPEALDHPELPPEAPVELVEEFPPENAADAQRKRDEKGRFSAKKEKASKLAAEVNGQQTPADATVAPSSGGAASSTPEPTPATQTTTHKAPAGWTAAEREHFTKAPPELQAVISRREREIAIAVQESAPAKKFQQDFHGVVSPYLGMIQSEGGDALGTMKNLFQTYGALRTAPPNHRAKIVADLVRTFGVPIDALDSHLAGEAPQERQNGHVDPAEIARQAEERVWQRINQGRQQQVASQGVRDVQAFEQKQPEFFNDLRESMADILELDGRNKARLPDGHPGKLPMSIDEAYDRASKFHPEVSKILQQREAAQQAKARAASTQRTAAAASSIKSQPSARGNSAGPATRRDAILASIQELSGQ